MPGVLGGLARRVWPRSFQARLTWGFVAVVTLTLVLVSGLVLRSLDEYFDSQEQVDLSVRAATVRDVIIDAANSASGDRPIVAPDNTVDALVQVSLNNVYRLHLLADRIAQANVQVRLGTPTNGAQGLSIVPAPGAVFAMALAATPQPGQAREPMSKSWVYPTQQNQLFSYAIEVTLSDPYTFKASTLRDVTSLLLVIAVFTLGMSMAVAWIIARRFTTPLRRLTEASRRIAEGDLASRVPVTQAEVGGAELAELSTQFNAMAARLQESVDTIRRDRDRSRDFLADVSHELRTPLAALRTFNELLLERAGDDPAARAEFLESSAQQIERLDWLAQNLLELSKLDSGLVLLDLRPEDLRAAVESAVEQAEAAARKRGVRLKLYLPSEPVRIRHDPQRIGQVVSNLVGNALKFTPRSGAVDVELRAVPDGAEIEVRDTGVGIDASELPRIFERFFRGSRANEARGSGSGLGLAIVKSIVDMHGGRITVESRLGVGTTFVVTLPRDPRAGEPMAAPRPRTVDADDTSPSGGGEIRERAPGTDPLAPQAPAEPSPPGAPLPQSRMPGL